MVNLYLFIVFGRLLCNRAKPVVGHFSGDRGRLSLVVTVDDLDASTLEPVEDSFQGGVGHYADLVPDNHTGNKLLPHPFRRPLRLATPNCSTTLCATQLRLPSLNGARFAGSGSLMG